MALYSDRPTAVAIGVGLLAHLVFNRLTSARRGVGIWAILLICIPLFASITLSFLENVSVLYSVLRMYAVFVPTLLSSLVLYRLSPFHPLASYPGPLINRVTFLRMAYVASTGKRHLYLRKLHRKYGSHVRIGPNAISIVHVGAIKECLGTPHMLRDMLYRSTEPDHVPASIITSLALSVEQHAAKRKIWNQAFTGPVLKEYDRYINNRSDTFIESIGKQEGVVDVAMWLGYFTYDFMGDLMFGGGFDMLREGDKGGYWKFIRDTMTLVTVIEYLSYMANMLPYLPVSEGLKRFETFVLDRLEIRRSRTGPVTRDLFHHVSNEAETRVEKSHLPSIVTDAMVGIVAGADTTAVIMACSLHALMVDRRILHKLIDEIDQHFDRHEDPKDPLKLSSMPYLNAVINETLRMFPAVPSQLARTPNKGSGGKMVGGQFVPEGTEISLPIYVYHRDPKYFQPDPDTFRPERWTTPKGQYAVFMDSNAYMPFSFGPAHCIGKHLALRSIRVMIARTVQKFDMEFAKGYNPDTWYDELKDDTTLAKGKLPVVLTLRK